MPETPISEMAVYSARPTVRINSQEYAKVSELVIGMEMTEQEGGMSTLELRLSNVASEPEGGADLAFEDDAILTLGATIGIYGGEELAPVEVFTGTIMAVEAHFPEEGPPELVVLAEDALQKARIERRTATYDDMSVSDLVSEIAGRLGLTPIVTGLTDNIGTWVQFNESDLAFLRRVLTRYDGDVQVVGDELHVSPRADVQRGTPELEMHSQLRRVRVIADLADQTTEVTVTGWDPIQGRRVSGAATGTNLAPGSGQTGSQVLRDAIGERRHHLSHLTASTDEEATALAEAAFDRRARRFVVVDATSEGNPVLRVGTHVTLTGMGERFDNTYYIVRACHRWDDETGYWTDFEAECAYWGGG